VRNNEEQKAVIRLTEEVSIPPKPVVMHQDVSATGLCCGGRASLHASLVIAS
jgi:hypothetical protein